MLIKRRITTSSHPEPIKRQHVSPLATDLELSERTRTRTEGSVDYCISRRCWCGAVASRVAPSGGGKEPLQHNRRAINRIHVFNWC